MWSSTFYTNETLSFDLTLPLNSNTYSKEIIAYYIHKANPTRVAYYKLKGNRFRKHYEDNPIFDLEKVWSRKDV